VHQRLPWTLALKDNCKAEPIPRALV
jgi:hypothetical protein